MVKQIVTEEISILKRQARRRLMGAIALTILVVILLPMLLDSEPSTPTPSKDIELQIPDKDKVGEFVPNMVLPPLNAVDSQAGSSQPTSAPVIVPLLDVKPINADVAQPKIESNPGIASEAKPAIEIKPKIEQQIKPADTKPKVEAQPLSKATSNAHSGFIIQVGAFDNADAAKKLQEKLHQQGYPSYTEKMKNNKVRVRVGDYTSHAEAEKIRRKLEIQGHKPNVINLK